MKPNIEEIRAWVEPKKAPRFCQGDQDRYDREFVESAKRDLPALLARIDVLEKVLEAAKNHSCLMGTAQLAAALADEGRE